ncbi:hypothetical protein ACFRMQ_11405 [Kitasatospora sp. NPDC056783]|uniref:hypothetical protein n=1 Tax=Kitasatospora sp. NPDC056783 TaxID=3345943 RepID=UPI0036A0A291
MRRTTPEDMIPTMTAWYPGLSKEALAFVCEIAAEVSDDNEVPDRNRASELLNRVWKRLPEAPAGTDSELRTQVLGLT